MNKETNTRYVILKTQNARSTKKSLKEVQRKYGSGSKLWQSAQTSDTSGHNKAVLHNYEKTIPNLELSTQPNHESSVQDEMQTFPNAQDFTFLLPMQPFLRRAPETGDPRRDVKGRLG